MYNVKELEVYDVYKIAVFTMNVGLSSNRFSIHVSIIAVFWPLFSSFNIFILQYYENLSTLNEVLMQSTICT